MRRRDGVEDYGGKDRVFGETRGDAVGARVGQTPSVSSYMEMMDSQLKPATCGSRAVVGLSFRRLQRHGPRTRERSDRHKRTSKMMFFQVFMAASMGFPPQPSVMAAVMLGGRSLIVDQRTGAATLGCLRLGTWPRSGRGLANAARRASRGRGPGDFDSIVHASPRLARSFGSELWLGLEP